ncbi:hypothetical protein AMAG_01213 [Allomyces macrogynus ATCC 38327]|uniref:SprT-like domain-containing protein n=1 Tax=Allomyces macrogynus (strain ATCC 38327) TaxID=578462 RepID=A0A0L0RY69_ALLM3|nr:hypothetical protein AMAG_01213 [Allomyces macrogynus ATCC 38327]|eukprot:KNE55308.1 hypothetical protein AMAG_01213 [Allomyces macrogynus ATCC 38327]
MSFAPPSPLSRRSNRSSTDGSRASSGVPGFWPPSPDLRAALAATKARAVAAVSGRSPPAPRSTTSSSTSSSTRPKPTTSAVASLASRFTGRSSSSSTGRSSSSNAPPPPTPARAPARATAAAARTNTSSRPSTPVGGSAYLFVTDGNDDHDGHGTAFHEWMHKLNAVEPGANISVFHTFRDEVNAARKHVWKCNGPCKDRPPYFGIVRRSMNRAPQPADRWWADHKRTCGGTYTKIQGPDIDANGNSIPKPASRRARKSDPGEGRRLGMADEDDPDPPPPPPPPPPAKRAQDGLPPLPPLPPSPAPKAAIPTMSVSAPATAVTSPVSPVLGRRKPLPLLNLSLASDPALFDKVDKTAPPPTPITYQRHSIDMLGLSHLHEERRSSSSGDSFDSTGSAPVAPVVERAPVPKAEVGNPVPHAIPFMRRSFDRPKPTPLVGSPPMAAARVIELSRSPIAEPKLLHSATSPSLAAEKMALPPPARARLVVWPCVGNVAANDSYC